VCKSATLAFQFQNLKSQVRVESINEESFKLSLESLDAKKARLAKLRNKSTGYIKNLEEWFRVDLTYNSNAIEGNTLNRRETALVIEKGMTVKGRL
jgi:Fic family protein